MSRRSLVALYLLVLVACVLAAGILIALAASPQMRPTPTAPTTPGPSAEASAPATASRPPLPSVLGSGTWTVAEILERIPVVAETVGGYERSLFIHWIDADNDGCDARDEVLIRDAIVAPRVGARCRLTFGTWLSRYDGVTISDPARLEVDHVVALAEAWDSGAWAWDQDRRMRFANDLGAEYALRAVTSASNQAKSDSDPADWLPPRATIVCTYLAEWLGIKARWGLSIDRRERDAIAAHAECAGTMVAVVIAR